MLTRDKNVYQWYSAAAYRWCASVNSIKAEISGTDNNSNGTQCIRSDWITAEVCSWTSDNISSARGARLRFCSGHDRHNRLRHCTRTNAATISSIYTERSHAVVCCLCARCSYISSVYSVAGRWHCITDCIDSGCKSWGLRHLHHSADSVAVSDDSMSVEATSLSDVTGSNTLLH